MEIITPEFENQEEKSRIMLITLFSLVPIIPIVMYFMGQKFSGGANKIFKALVNFEIIILLAGIIIYKFFPYGYEWGNVVPVINAIVIFMILASLNNNTEVKIPVLFKFIQ